jgi:hypothetical protein
MRLFSRRCVLPSRTPGQFPDLCWLTLFKFVLSVHGAHLTDVAFMRRTPQSTVMEFFPPYMFNRDCEIVVQSLGIRYIAWQGDQCVFFLLPLFSSGR